MKNYCIIFLIVILLVTYSVTARRSKFRKKDPTIPEITIGWKGSPKRITRTDWHYNEYPIFTTFNEHFFYTHMLPQGSISPRCEGKQSIECMQLASLIEELLKEIKKKKKKYANFTVLRSRDFNVNQKCGLLILKFNNYPFVLKLFIETPKTFVDPYYKGFDQFFFYMSGGINRHIAGLTRIKNVELIQKQVNEHYIWKDRVIMPRKWYWLPKHPFWLDIRGKNIGGKQTIHTKMPGVYAIIADEMDTQDNMVQLSAQERSELVMKLCMDLHLFVDPHSDNFVVKYNEKTNLHDITIVDTEHFPSVVGLKEEPFFTNHFEWGLYLSAKFFQDAFLQTKQDMLNAQIRENPYALRWE